MNRRPIWLALSAVVFSLAVVSQAWADPAPKFPPYAQVIGEAQTIPGLLMLHRKDMRLLAEISQADLNKDFIVAIAIARGIGQTPLLGGMTVHFDDTWVWQFRKVEDRIQIVRRNVRFRANSGSPQEKAVYLSYTDSILFSLPIATMSPTGNFVVDLTPVFMSDLPQFSHIFPGFGFAPDRSTWAKIKGFPTNVEIEVAATYASSGMALIDTVPDTRAATLYVHYSISRLPETGYQPRLADDRVGYFLTVIKDFSKVGQRRSIRAIHRSLGLAQGRAVGRGVAAGDADRLLDREDGALQVSRGGPRGDIGVEQGIRAGGLLQRHRGAPAARRRHLGSRRYPLQHLPLDYRERRLRHGAGPDESADRPDSRRRHYLRRRFHRNMDEAVGVGEVGRRLRFVRRRG